MLHLNNVCGLRPIKKIAVTLIIDKKFPCFLSILFVSKFLENVAHLQPFPFARGER